jgi:hypothetical protein|tara:strand:+ start:839 stop:982 length:144 start_codon:yes stop_codon:yes gene_type:complete
MSVTQRGRQPGRGHWNILQHKTKAADKALDNTLDKAAGTTYNLQSEK